MLRKIREMQQSKITEFYKHPVHILIKCIGGAEGIACDFCAVVTARLQRQDSFEGEKLLSNSQLLMSHTH